MEENNEKRFQSNKKYFTICIYAIVTFSICLFIYKFIDNWEGTKERIASLTSMLAPFLLAFLLVYIVTPMVKKVDKFLFKRLEKYERLSGIHKAISLVIVYVVLISIISVILTFFIPQIITSITDLIGQSRYLYNNFERMFSEFALNHPELDLQLIQEFINNNLNKLLSNLNDYLGSIIPVIYQAGRSIVSWVINIALAFVISCYLLWDQSRILETMKRIVRVFFNDVHAKTIFKTTKECNRMFSQYIIGKAIDSLIIGILCFILMCSLKLPYALIISVVVGITNMIPYFGPLIGAVPGALLLLLISPKQCLIFIIMIFCLQQFDGTILGPKILGNSTGLSPIWVIFGILAGSYVAGVLGMFIGVPFIAVVTHLLNKWMDYWIKRKRRLADPNYKDEVDIPRMTDEELGFEYEE